MIPHCDSYTMTKLYFLGYCRVTECLSPEGLPIRWHLEASCLSVSASSADCTMLLLFTCVCLALLTAPCLMLEWHVLSVWVTAVWCHCNCSVQRLIQCSDTRKASISCPTKLNSWTRSTPTPKYGHITLHFYVASSRVVRTSQETHYISATRPTG
jgi:hypothetical protein